MTDVAFQHGTLLHLHCYSLDRMSDADGVVGSDGLLVHKVCAEPRPIAGGAHTRVRTVRTLATFFQRIFLVTPRCGRYIQPGYNIWEAWN